MRLNGPAPTCPKTFPKIPGATTTSTNTRVNTVTSPTSLLSAQTANPAATASTPTSLAGRINMAASGPRPAGSGSSGITLVEMLVVMTIIGLLVGLSYPSIAAGVDSVRLRSATDSVSTILNSAVTRAERRQEP